MKIIKYLCLFAFMAILFTSCADSKTFVDKNGKEFTVEPYGWANETAKKNDTIVYQVSAGNVVWSIIGIETVVIPVVLTGYYLYEPVGIKKQ